TQPPPPATPGPSTGTEFVVEMRSAAATPIPAPEARALLLKPSVRAALDFPRAWAEAHGPSGAIRWTPLEEVPDAARLSRLAFAWPLADLLAEGEAAIRGDLRRFAVESGRAVAGAGLTAAPREDAGEAARRAQRLLDLKRRFGHSVEMRLMPHGRPFPARDVWRALYGLGLTWGDLDLFHWHDPATGARRFTVSAVGHAGYFLPERAVEGEGVGGISLAFELPYSPAPLEVYDRMAVALAYLRAKLGGHPVSRSGAELDGDRLHDDRDALEEAVEEMEKAGIAPGSPDAERFF
ncbi:MAG TPA: cell division protein ZipA C-terminal FtsZ-binding domain-containing protein, partial [Armatimonadaceae bacterium]|nr:cell division protein ZipA C-terminal FtsZ-binding domain-containing protein [Armatimonadaceae bacterium]